jgi:hypothetical protein
MGKLHGFLQLLKKTELIIFSSLSLPLDTRAKLAFACQSLSSINKLDTFQMDKYSLNNQKDRHDNLGAVP